MSLGARPVVVDHSVRTLTELFLKFVSRNKMLIFWDFGGGALRTQQRVGAPRRWLRGAGRTQGYTVGAWKRDRPLAIRQGVLAKSAILTFFGFARTGIELGKAPQAVDCAIRCAHVFAFRKSWG